jgi:hypothetical protein
MLQIQRLALVWSSTIFFLVTAPWLVVYALGYDVDILNTDLKNALTVSTETAPDGARIDLRSSSDNTVEYSNGTFRMPAGESIIAKINKKDYFIENFNIRGDKNQNSLARLQKIFLLPTTPSLSQTLPSQATNISFVSKDYLIYELPQAESSSKKDIYLQLIGFGEFLGNPIKLSQQGSDLKLQEGSYWEFLAQNIFWQKDSGILIYKTDSEWRIWDSTTSIFGKSDVVWLNNLSFLLKPENIEIVYVYNFENGQYRSLADKVSLVSQNDANIWLLSAEKLLLSTKPQLLDTDSNISQAQFFTADSFPDINQNLQSVKYIKTGVFFEGSTLQLDSKLYYRLDKDPEKWHLLASDVKNWNSNSNSIFWQDSDSYFKIYNTQLQHFRFLGRPQNIQNEEVMYISYFPKWQRYQIYTQNNQKTDLKIHSLWFSQDFVNNSITSFSWVRWIDQVKACSFIINNNSQICVNSDTRLSLWKNNS